MGPVWTICVEMWRESEEAAPRLCMAPWRACGHRSHCCRFDASPRHSCSCASWRIRACCVLPDSVDRPERRLRLVCAANGLAATSRTRVRDQGTTRVHTHALLHRLSRRAGQLPFVGSGKSVAATNWMLEQVPGIRSPSGSVPIQGRRSAAHDRTQRRERLQTTRTLGGQTSELHRSKTPTAECTQSSISHPPSRHHLAPTLRDVWSSACLLSECGR